MNLRIGVDLGGTKIEIAALDAAGAVLLRERRPTPQGDYRATVGTVAAMVEDVEQRLGARGSVGVGIPGTESQATGLIKNANSTCLIGQPLRRDLSVLLQREVRLANDANCFALSEAVDGAGEGAQVVFGVILGTGVGGGIVVDGRVLAGVNGIAGEWGHNYLPPDPVPGGGGDAPALRHGAEAQCYCGRRGCVETYLSGPALEADGGAADPAAMARYEARLARALANVINILDPEVIVLGGGLSNLDRLYDSVPRLWGAHIFSDTVATRLVRHRHGDSSGVRGAAWLWP